MLGDKLLVYLGLEVERYSYFALICPSRYYQRSRILSLLEEPKWLIIQQCDRRL